MWAIVLKARGGQVIFYKVSWVLLSGGMLVRGLAFREERKVLKYRISFCAGSGKEVRDI